MVLLELDFAGFAREAAMSASEENPSENRFRTVGHSLRNLTRIRNIDGQFSR